MLKFSDYNIFSKFRDSDNHFIVNLLSGNADILSQEEASKIKLAAEGKLSPGDQLVNELIEKGYMADDAEESSLFRKKYLDFLDHRDKDEIQIFFVPGYSCNFSCSYCYQDQYINPDKRCDKEVVDAFFSYVETTFSGRRKYITLFGGEPLLTGDAHKTLIGYILEKSKALNIQVCVVTNGYSLPEYTGILSKGIIREIQVTLDGTENTHDSRRHLKGGGRTFKRIAEGIDACLKNNFPVNLRMVIDRDNIEDITGLAHFAAERGWTGNPLFKTQAGRNYELHHCQDAKGKLFDRLSLYEKLYEIIKLHPEVEEFYKPAYSVSRFLSENGSLPDPLFDSCPACKTEWAFDYTGRIYPCTATVGKSEECLGTFYPSVKINPGMTDKWENRDVVSIKECGSCNLRLACGGGCGSVAKNMTGEISAPDCRPVRELLEIGFSAYFPAEK